MDHTLADIQPDHVFDGGDLDCGSGLILLIRQAMLKVPKGGVLEMRSREPTVGDELPPWCRLVGHQYLGGADGDGHRRYFVRRGGRADDEQALEADKNRAQSYEWRARVRSSAHLASTVYCRNFSFVVGQPASFEERDAHPSAVEYVLGALGGALSTAFATECAQAGLEIDDVEVSVRGKLSSVLTHLGLEEDGDPAFSSIEVKCYASTMDDASATREAWERTVRRSPLAATLAKAVPMTMSLAIV